ncbi:crosslink repair DNA glycosylase YcaQ family protein [Enterovirga sp.]|uniref:winged helix-turn-helix domain-containing protein n=1 Tax=Enterovirga sp. TaxID=2026350 RepID=UPI0026206CE2|nr:crosslink repair DNA glycosylase YcaQ family protein [Enterovirga sp.]MDB5590353.1 cytoplasmic protein [Enterovirga sp.]
MSGRAAGPGLRPLHISAPSARRIALAAAGFREPRVEQPTARHLARVVGRLGLVQIDSVNVLARAHYVPAFSRLGPYPAALLDRAAYAGRGRSLFEYWGHEASLIRLDLQPALRWRMEEARSGRGIYGGLARFAAERQPFIEAVLREVESAGPITAGELAEAGASRKGWWEWSDGKRALEWLFWAGLVTTRTRRNFARVYDLPERVLPPEVLARPTPEPSDAHRELVRVAARALGVATEPDLRDYFRLDPARSRAAVAALVEAGDLLPASVEGWAAPAYLDRDAAVPRRIAARSLVSPFDPLVWSRDRTERLFGFRYRIEIYMPAHKRQHGYYALPFLLGDRLAARVDLKADRAAGRLLVQHLHVEPTDPDPAELRAALEAELTEMARWLELDRGREALPA